MRIAFFVNDVMTEDETYTTNGMAMAALAQGHEAWVIGASDFKYSENDTVHATARHVPKKNYKSQETYLRDLQSDRAKKEIVCVDDLDILFLRSDPSVELGKRNWAQAVGIDFGRIAMRNGVLVVNDPNGLSKAMNKMYFQLFPEEVRPRTVITRSKQQIKEFVKKEGGTIILKPLQGSGGQGVFLVNKQEASNLNQIIDSLTKDGYVIAQEYLPEAKNGDTRFFLMNGMPLKYNGKYAAFRRVGAKDDIRSNIHAGGSVQQAEITGDMLKLAEMVRPKLVQDGMFLVGLDVVGDKLMEINVFSPGGLSLGQKFEKVNFCHAIINALEKKNDYIKYYKRDFYNVEMNTM